ncbi:MAG: sulfotransferase [Pirellulales bacterium]|nr:sulfotransferase [Pirellulales bacterium]
MGHTTHRHKPDFRINKAQAAWKARRYDDAIWYYERALARDPNNAILLVDVARAYGLRFRPTDAEKLINKAFALYPDDVHLLQMLGRSYEMLKQFDRAIDCYQRALELEPQSQNRPWILIELAKMHERLHALDTARRCADEAISLAPRFDQAHYILAILQRRSGETEAAQNRLRQLIDSKHASAGVVADSWYQLAMMQDQSGHYEEAFDSLTRAKQIFDQAAMPYRLDAKAIAKKSREMLRTITSEQCERWNAMRDQLTPLPSELALLTSHPRSGTTLLEQILDSHAGVISADELQIMVELIYMPLGRKTSSETPVPEMLDQATNDDLMAARQNYWMAMEGALREPIEDRILLDKNPELTNLLPLVGRVFPEMKVIFAIRDPRDVVISCFMQQLPLNPVSIHYLTLEDTARKYSATMRAWLKLRDMIRNPWIEVRYEEMVEGPEYQARRVLKFLDLAWDDSVLDYHRRAQRKHVHSPTYEAVTRPIYKSSIGRWKNYATQLEPCMKVLEPFVEVFGYE